MVSSDGLPMAGLVLNHPQPRRDEASQSNRAELESRCIPPLLAELAYGSSTFDSHVDWYEIAGTTFV